MGRHLNLNLHPIQPLQPPDAYLRAYSMPAVPPGQEPYLNRWTGGRVKQIPGFESCVASVQIDPYAMPARSIELYLISVVHCSVSGADVYNGPE